jgi:ABC-type sugar transport system ATPase subunit
VSKDRNIAMVVQDHALYPHMTVADSLGFALNIAAAGVSDDVLQASAAHGQPVAAEILGWAESDGYTTSRAPYELPTREGVWELAPPATAPVEPHRGTLRTFALDTAQQERPVTPPPYSAEPDSQFAAQARQVYDASLPLTDEQHAAARF